MSRAVCCILHVPCSMLYITCPVQYVVYYMSHVVCCILHVPCSMLYITCPVQYVVYYMSRAVCGELYVGETERSVLERFAEHYREARVFVARCRWNAHYRASHLDVSTSGIFKPLYTRKCWYRNHPSHRENSGKLFSSPTRSLK